MQISLRKFKTLRSRSRISPTAENSNSRAVSSQSFSQGSFSFSGSWKRNKHSSSPRRLQTSIFVRPRLISLGPNSNQATPTVGPSHVKIDSLPRTDSRATKTFKMICKSYGLKRWIKPIGPGL